MHPIAVPAIAPESSPRVVEARAAAVILIGIGGDDRAHALALVAADTTAQSVVDARFFTGVDRNRALLAVDAFEYVQRLAVERGLLVDLYINSSVVQGWLARQRNLVVRARYFNGRGVAEIRTRAERVFAEHLAALRAGPDDEVGEVRPLTIATDASARARHRGVGIAYVTETGSWRQDFLPATAHVAVGEVAAIGLALRTERAGQIVVLSDNRAAVSWCRGRSEPPTREIARQVSGVRRAIDGRDVTIRWVKAHVGHHLNEAADRLAVAARRNAVAGVCAATRTEIAQRIVAEMVAFDSVA